MSRPGGDARTWTSVVVHARTTAVRGTVRALRRTRLNLQHKLALAIALVQRTRHRSALRDSAAANAPAMVIDRGHPVPAAKVDGLLFDPHRLRLAEDLVGALRRAGARPTTRNARWDQPITITVDEADRDRILTAVRSLTDRHPGLVVQRYDQTLDRTGASDRTLAGFVLGPAIRTTLLRDRALGRPWSPGDARPAELSGTTWQVTEHAVDTGTGRHLGGPAAIRITVDEPDPAAEPELITEPIDVVYTWVDASDPAWQQQFAGARPGGRQTQAATVAARFRQYDELRYSLRSIAEFAPWARRIWVVTNGQVPHWYAGDHDRIRIVSHAELWRGEPGLPTFNSQAIEACLHRIEGLSERFLYFNDDFFLGRPVAPETFFHGRTGRPIVFPSNQSIPPGPPEPRDLAPDASGKNNRMLIAAATGAMVDHKYLHVPQSLSRSVLVELESMFPAAFAQTRQATFRSLSDLAACSLHHGYGLATGRAVAGRITQRYVDVESRACARDLADIARYRCYDAFCLNAIREDGDEQLIKDFLRRYYPVPAPWENDQDHDRDQERAG
ncbi:stealth conserved region 3 domain-containing protein [Microlunatus sp. GCM10028923]|uniref:stealth family protein n=1 Tax=Microlunatus sp. GCM10028923 TaxID=3273400 RepID=UPI00360D7BC2